MLPRPTAEPVAASTKPIRDDHWLCACLAMSAFPCGEWVRRGRAAAGAAGGGVRVHAGSSDRFTLVACGGKKARILNVRGPPPNWMPCAATCAGSVPTPLWSPDGWVRWRASYDLDE